MIVPACALRSHVHAELQARASLPMDSNAGLLITHWVPTVRQQTPECAALTDEEARRSKRQRWLSAKAAASELTRLDPGDSALQGEVAQTEAPPEEGLQMAGSHCVLNVAAHQAARPDGASSLPGKVWMHSGVTERSEVVKGLKGRTRTWSNSSRAAVGLSRSLQG